MIYFCVIGTIFFTVYGQLILKWRISFYGDLPIGLFNKLIFLTKLILDPYIFSGLAGAFLASLLWMAALTKLELSYIYPFLGLTFILVLTFSVIIFKEPLTLFKLIGVGFIALGIIISSRSL